MAPKTSGGRVESMENELEEMKLQLQRLPGLERMVEHMAQNFVKMMQTLEDTQKSVQSLASAQAKSKMTAGEPSSRPMTSSPTGCSRDAADLPFGVNHDG